MDYEPIGAVQSDSESEEKEKKVKKIYKKSFRFNDDKLYLGSK